MTYGRSTAIVGTRYLQARPRSSLRMLLQRVESAQSLSSLVFASVFGPFGMWSDKQMRRTCASYCAVRSIGNML